MFDLLGSDDMEKLSRVIDARCRNLNTRADSIEGQMLASQLLDRSKAELWMKRSCPHARSQWKLSSGMGDDGPQIIRGPRPL